MGRSWIAGRRGNDDPNGNDDMADDGPDASGSTLGDGTAHGTADGTADEPDNVEPDQDAPAEQDASAGKGAPTQKLAGAVEAVQRSILDITALQWAWMAGSILIGVAANVLVGAARDAADGTVEGEHAQLWNDAIGQLGAVVVILAVLYTFSWLHEAGVNSSYQRWGLRWSPVVIVACLLPGFGVLGTSWEPYERIGAVAADVLTNAAFEEMAFRGLLLIVLARGLADHRHGVLISAIAAGLVYGIVDVSVGAAALGVLFSLAFVRLILDTNSIWPAVVLHAMFDWLGEFPYLEDGTAEGSGWTALAVFVLVVAAVHASVRLVGVHAPWRALMSPNVAPVARR